MLKYFKRRAAANRLQEEELYNVVAQELANEKKEEGLWAKATEASDGDESKIKPQYIKLRIQSLKDVGEMTQALIEAAAEAKMADQITAETELARAKQNATPRKTEDPIHEEAYIAVCVIASVFFIFVVMILLPSA